MVKCKECERRLSQAFVRHMEAREKIMKVLKEDPRLKLTLLAKKISRPISTTLDCLKELLQEYEIRGYWVPKPRGDQNEQH